MKTFFEEWQYSFFLANGQEEVVEYEYDEWPPYR